VSFDLRNNRLDMRKTPADDIPFASRILEQMDESDWEILCQAFYALKREYAANTPMEAMDFDFNSIRGDYYNSIDDGRLVPFHEVFPFLDELCFDINGEECIALPMFCLARACKCTTANIEIHDLKDQKIDLSVFVDYKKGTFNGFEKHRWNGKELTQERLAFILLGAFPDLFARLQEKHRQLSKLYKISHLKYYRANAHHDSWNSNSPFELPAGPFLREKEKVGRNDPCPCGSGKKYKKCCLK